MRSIQAATIYTSADTARTVREQISSSIQNSTPVELSVTGVTSDAPEVVSITFERYHEGNRAAIGRDHSGQEVVVLLGRPEEADTRQSTIILVGSAA